MLLEIVDELAGRDLEEYQRNQIGFSIVGQCMHYRFSGEMISMMISQSEFENHYQIEKLAEHITEFSVRAIRGVPSDLPV